MAWNKETLVRQLASKKGLRLNEAALKRLEEAAAVGKMSKTRRMDDAKVSHEETMF